jgi:hypothetical protein
MLEARQMLEARLRAQGRHAAMPNRTVVQTRRGVTVSSFVEFGYEIVCILPFAYWHHQRGLLAATFGVPGSHASFFFSPAHTELPKVARHQDNDLVWGIERGVDGLNQRNHDIPFLTHKWAMPNFDAHYAHHPIARALRHRWPRLCIVHNKRSNWPALPKDRSEFSDAELNILFAELRRHGLQARTPPLCRIFRHAS